MLGIEICSYVLCCFIGVRLFFTCDWQCIVSFVLGDVIDSKRNQVLTSDKPSDVYKTKQGTVTMGANFSRHSSKGMSGRRCQSISNICNSKDHYMDPSTREIDAAYKFCNSLPSPNGTACNNNYEHKPVSKKTSLPNRVSIIRLFCMSLYVAGRLICV